MTTIEFETLGSRPLYNKGFINGEWVEGLTKKSFDIVDPATGEVVTSVPDMDENDAEYAIDAASKALESWKRTTGKEKAGILRKWYQLLLANQEGLAQVMTRENGKPLREAMGEVGYAADFLELYAEEAKRIHGEVIQSPTKAKQMLLVRQPIGVVGMITPWNFPLAMIARKASAALAAGCTIVIKPAEDTPLSALQFAALGIEAGVPAGVVNVVTAERENTAGIGRKLCSSPLVAGISFTGSTAVGKLLYEQCAGTVKRLGLELGGNAPFIVFESADMDKAVAGAMLSKFRNAGQTCVCSNRIYVHESRYDEFIRRYEKEIASLVVGNGTDGSTSVGPLINAAGFNKVKRLVDDAKAKGAKVHIGGDAHSKGSLFYQPTLLTNINDKMDIASAEIFGPVAIVMSFKTEEEVIKNANNTPSGLAAYFFSNDISQMWRVARELDYGMVGINDGLISAAEAAFGGIKESGIGREGSKHGLDEYTYIKYMCFGNLE